MGQFRGVETTQSGGFQVGYPPSKMGLEPSSPRYGPFLEWAQQPSPAQSGHQKYTYQFRVVRGPMGQFRGVETTQSGGSRVGYPPSKMGFEPSTPRYGPFLEWAQQPSPARHVCRSVTCHGALWGGGPSSFGFFMCYRCCYKVVGTPHTPYLAGFHFGVSPSGHPNAGPARLISAQYFCLA